MADSKARYVDGFIMPVKRARLDEYREVAQLAGTVWREHGALEYVECVAEDVKPGKLTSFPQSVNLEEDEVVVFSWIVYESRQARDRTNEKAMNDPRLTDLDHENMPFSAKRMIYGGFEVLVSC